MTDGRSEPELAELVEELAGTMDALRRELERDGRPRPTRGSDRPPGPRPPGPRELLRFTETYTIPTLIAMLEAAVRSLELLQGTLRLLDGRGFDSDRDGRRGGGRSGRSRREARRQVGRVGRATMDRVDDALSDLGTAIEGGEPSDPTARDLLADARDLREEIDDRLREGRATADRSRRGERDTSEGQTIPVSESGSGGSAGADAGGHGSDDGGEGGDGGDGESGDGDDPPSVDVEAELETIRRDVERERGGSEPATGDDAGAGADSGGSGEAEEADVPEDERGEGRDDAGDDGDDTDDGDGAPDDVPPDSR